MKRLILVAVLLIGGCATSAGQMMNDAFTRYQGQPIDSLMTRWGQPDRARQEADRFVYVWDDPIMAQCRIAVHADPEGRIIGMLHKGNEEGCGGMFKLLHQ